MLGKILAIISFFLSPFIFFANPESSLPNNLSGNSWSDFNFFNFKKIEVGEWLGGMTAFVLEKREPFQLPLVSQPYLMSQDSPDFLPIRNWQINEPEIEAKAALIFDPGKDKILFQKNIEQVLPIASLTKLMTGLIVLEKMDLGEIVVVSESALAGYGEQGGLMRHETISVGNLLNILLIESSNDAALALAEAVEEKNSGVGFVSLMNQKAQDLGLKNTIFVEPSGYESGNVSTAWEIARLAEYSFNQPLLWQILKAPTLDVFSADGQIKHHLVNTDELLNRLPNIVGGKTGYTPEAQGCLLLVTEEKNGSSSAALNNSSHLITVILGAQERFLETERLLDWVREAYVW